MHPGNVVPRYFLQRWLRQSLKNAAGTTIGSAITLGGTGNTARTLTHTQFASAGASVAYAEVVATLGALTDKISVVRLQDGAAGANADNHRQQASRTRMGWPPEKMRVEATSVVRGGQQRQIALTLEAGD